MKLVKIIKAGLLLFDKKNYGFIFILVLLLFLQLFFLNSDPSLYLNSLRGPWTDPGLYSAQVKSFVSTGNWMMEKSPCLLITPLYNLILLIPFYIFGTSLIVVKWVNMVAFATLLFVSCRLNKTMISVLILFLILFGFQFQIFEFLHIGLVELMISGAFILLISIIAHLDLREKKFNHVQVIIITLISFGIALLKIQYAYALGIFPIYVLFSFLNKEINAKCFLKYAVWIGGFTFLLIIGYYLLWILPNKCFFIDTMSSVDASKYYGWDDSIEGLYVNWKRLFVSWENRFNTYLFLGTLIIGLINVFNKNQAQWIKKLNLVLIIWLILETTKLFQVFLPTRYVLSTYIALGLFACVQVYSLFFIVKNKVTRFSMLSVLGFLCLVISWQNAVCINRSFKERKYTLKKMNNYFNKTDQFNGLLIGSWAASCSAQSGLNAIPVWEGYFNCNDSILNNKDVIAVITELDEEDSNYCFVMQNINLTSQSDSIKTFKVGKWSLNTYWISNRSLKF
jgi:hypothetical protein